MKLQTHKRTMKLQTLKRTLVLPVALFLLQVNGQALALGWGDVTGAVSGAASAVGGAASGALSGVKDKADEAVSTAVSTIRSRAKKQGIKLLHEAALKAGDLPVKTPELRFGEVDPKYGKRWMSFIKDDTPLLRLAIPGTHDSAASMRKAGKTQDWDVSRQLNNGIRFLDVRVSNMKNGSFVLRHGATHLGSFNDLVLKPVNAFLKQNSSEVIVMSIKHEEAHDKKTLGKNMEKLVRDNSLANHDGSRFYKSDSPMNNAITLKEVRGKIVVTKRYIGTTKGSLVWPCDAGYRGATMKKSTCKLQDDYELALPFTHKSNRA